MEQEQEKQHNIGDDSDDDDREFAAPILEEAEDRILTSFMSKRGVLTKMEAQKAARGIKVDDLSQHVKSVIEVGD